jgi:glycine/D-amino acid oxidase-like deaminating enzyme
VTAGSVWAATLPAAARVEGSPLDGDLDVDVAVVGAGYTGLWTAYYLAAADPGLRVVVLERDVVGFGASGRNGGWCSALLATGISTLARRRGRAAAIAMQQAMYETVDEVGRVVAAEGIDAQFTKGGTITLARTEAHEHRLDEELAEARSFGFGEEHLRRLSADEVEPRCRATGTRMALFTPDCAAIHPLRLAHGLAGAVQRRGVRFCEHTAVTGLEPGRVTTTRGAVRAEVTVLATEAFGAQLPGRRRTLAPLYSLMVATEPIGEDQWAQIGLVDRPTFTDARHTIIYGQRTADGRLAFGGRGAPYHYASRIDPSFDTDERVRRLLVETARELFPVLADVPFPFHWGGAIGVPRDWQCSVTFDRSQGLAVAGGYVGDGVATTNLAGRTLADLITGRASDLVELPWVGHRSRQWEPEPLRWLGINATLRVAGWADAAESRPDGSPRVARLWRRALTALSGR